MRRRTSIDLKTDFKNDLKQEAKGFLKVILSILSEKALEFIASLVIKFLKKNQDVEIIEED